MNTTTVESQHRKQTRSERKAFIEGIKKEMAEKYRAFMEREKEKKESIEALIAEYVSKATGLKIGQKQFKALMAEFKNKVVEVQLCN